MLIGTTVNALAIILGSCLGLLLKKLPSCFARRSTGNIHTLGQRLQTIMMQGLALCVLYIGFSGSLSGQNGLIPLISMVLGTIVGELLDLDHRLRQLGDRVQAGAARLHPGNITESSISEGFVASSLLFCVGAMSIVGALQDGLTADHTTLFAKAVLDGTTSILFSASLGVGVLLSAAAVFLYQGSIAAAASFLQPFLMENVIAEMTCVGSLLIIALGLNMLELTKIKVMNMVPAMFFPILLCQLF